MTFYKYLSPFGLFLTLSTPTFAQNYPVSDIPDDLKLKAHAVVRNRTETFTVEGIDKAVIKIESVITVLDEKGASEAIIMLGYNKFTKITDIQAQLYDANGKQLKRLKRADIENYNTSSGNNSIDDSFVKIASLSHTSYPYTVEYEAEYTSKNMMFYPTWEAYPGNSEGVSVQGSRFVVSVPEKLSLRYKEQKLPKPCEITKNKNGSTTYRWEVYDLKAFEAETNQPNPSRVLPVVYTAPTAFQVDDYVGKVDSWADIASFYAELNKNRQEISTQYRAKIAEIGGKNLSKKEKIKQLYDFLQGSTRYVSIQLGIGGWQTITADDVARRGYGDCKALTNYMQALLAETGVASHQVLINAGDDAEDLMTDFPAFQFNHVFLCVPVEKDTLWLECTSQNNPFGYLSDFTSGRHGLLITDKGGQLIKTPTYKSSDNQQNRVAKVTFADDGTATVQMKTFYTGLQRNTPADVINGLGAEAQKKWLANNISLPSIEIVKYGFKEKKDIIPSIEEFVELNARNVCAKSGSRVFLNPNFFNQQKSVPVAINPRKFDIELSTNYADTDSVWLNIPVNYQVEYLPETVKIETKYGKYQASCQKIGERLLYVRRVESQKGLYPASEFTAWADYRKKLTKADKNQVVLVQK